MKDKVPTNTIKPIKTVINSKNSLNAFMFYSNLSHISFGKRL